MFDAVDLPGDVYGTASSGHGACSSAAFNFTVHVAIPDSGQLNALLICRCSISEAAASDAEERKFFDFARREQENSLVFLTEKCITRKSCFQLRPFGMDAFDTRGPEAKTAVGQFSEIRARSFNQPMASCHRKISKPLAFHTLQEAQR